MVLLFLLPARHVYCVNLKLQQFQPSVAAWGASMAQYASLLDHFVLPYMVVSYEPKLGLLTSFTLIRVTLLLLLVLADF